MTALSLRVLLVFPRFNDNSFWSFKDACDVWGAKCPAPPLGLITLAAMLPAHWDLRLVNRNAQTLEDDDLAWAELVMTGGMMPQQVDTLEVIETCRARGLPVCVGGPGPTSNPRFYEEADFLVLGEAEGVLDQFVAAWEGGARHGRFEAEKFKADVTASPIPRFDLIDFKHYLYVGVQFSRGWPVHLRVLRHNRALRPGAAHQDQRPDAGRTRPALRARLPGPRPATRRRSSSSCRSCASGRSGTVIRSCSRRKPPSTSPTTRRCWP